MAAIITDQFRILNTKNFRAGVAASENSYYTWIGLPNASEVDPDWDTTPPDPRDCFDEENSYWDTMIALKKINDTDIKQVIRKVEWKSGVTFDMYRHNVKAENPSRPSGAINLYDANYYILNSDYRVYICLQNGTNPENPSGRASLDEPRFTDLEPREAGTSGDGYIWKYLYTIKPSDIVKFESTFYMPVPEDWSTNPDCAAVYNQSNEPNNQLKTVVIENRGSGVGAANKVYTRVPINGDGTGAEATVTVNNNSRIESVTISRGGDGYTYGTLDLEKGGVPTAASPATFNVIIPPQGNHGHDIYRELGAKTVLVYSRIENDIDNPDFVTGNQFARIGIVENPEAQGSTDVLTLDKASALGALKLVGIGYSTVTITPDSYITQTVGAGKTAVGRVVAYDPQTGVLKFWQDRTMAGFNTDGTPSATPPTYGYELQDFTGAPTNGGSLTVTNNTITLDIDNTFDGRSVVINSKTYNLGQEFTDGVSLPEVKKYSGNIIYVDNRPSVTRSPSQKEDIKVILQF